MVAVRTAELTDVETLRDVFRRSSLSDEGDRAHLLAHPDALDWDADPVGEGRTRIACVDDVVVGFATTHAVPDGLELDDLFVVPEWMRRGIGRALVEDLVTLARHRRVRRLSVTANENARAFYERLWFVAHGVEATRFGPARRMHRELEVHDEGPDRLIIRTVDRGHVVMGLLFFPRGGSAQVARYLSTALIDAGWSLELVTGSLGDPGEDTHAPTFFGATPLRCLDYSHAMSVFAAGGSAVGAPLPMHPSYEDREGAPDVVFSAVPADQGDRLASAWEAPLRAAGVDRAQVLHLHHLTPQHDAVRRSWPRAVLVAHLHGTELKFLEAVDERAAVAAALGTTLAGMPEWVRTNPEGGSRLVGPQRDLLRTTRWSQWVHGEAWRDRLRRQARAADHLIVVSPADLATAVDILQVDAERVSDVPNGVDVAKFRPRPMSSRERRAHFRRWLVVDPRGWDETTVEGSVAYREPDLDRLLGPAGDATVLIFVGRFTSAKRVPLLVRAFARARPQFRRPTSLVVWGGHPGEWEDEHPVTVARDVGADGVFFAGWRGHDELPSALAACDALVMPSVNDSYPQAPLEAMAVGLPVIATESGGFPLMVNLDPSRPTGWLVPPDDEHALVDALVDAVNRPEEIVRRGAHALAHARAHLSWAGRVARIEEAYARAADVRAARGSV